MTRKIAELGGDGQNDSFELAFSNLAHAYIREKAPTLEPYELGFQMLERADDGERAAGITGFDVGGRLLYSPVFWLRGRIKGHELLYIKEHDMFCPMKENWINYMLQRKPPRIGESVSRNRNSLGIRQPDLSRMTRSPYKYAAAQAPAWANAGRDALLACRMRKSGQTFAVPSLPDFIRQLGRTGFELFNKVALHAPTIASEAHKLHGDSLLDALTDAAHSPAISKRAAARDQVTRKQIEKKVAAPVRMISYRMAIMRELPLDVTDSEREEIIRDGYSFRDDRTDSEVSKAYKEEPRISMFNPSETGIYDVITKFHGLQKCLVIHRPWGTKSRSSEVIVVRLEGARHYIETEASQIWAVQQYEKDELTKLVNDLPKPDRLSAAEDEAILITPDGVASIPFRVRGGTWDKDDISAYSVSGQCSYGGQVVVDNKPGTRFRAVDNMLWVPSSAKQLSCSYGGYDDKKFALGRAADLKNQLFCGLAKIAIHRAGDDIVIKTAAGSSTPLSSVGAMQSLVFDHGLRPAVAKSLLKTAAVQNHVRCFIKYASPYLTDATVPSPIEDLQNQFGSYQTRAGETYPEQEPEHLRTRVDYPQEEMPYQEEMQYVDGGAMEVAQNAAQSGQKDVFDASVMTTMLRNMRDDQLIDRFVPALARAMDATGRLLFQFYWHMEDFSERYGDRDMPELEDSLRNLFEGLGDVVLKLKQKTVDPYPEEQQLGVSLTDLAGAS